MIDTEKLYNELGELEEKELLVKICIETEFYCNVYDTKYKDLIRFLKQAHKSLKNNNK